MTVERALRLIAGGFVILSVLLGIYVNANFLWFTLFVGVNLFQSGFTNWCPMMAVLRRAACQTPLPRRRQSQLRDNAIDTEDRSSGLAHLRRRSRPVVGAAGLAPPAAGGAHLSSAAPTPVGGDGQLRGMRRRRVATAVAPIVKELIHAIAQCEPCEERRDLLEEVASLSDPIMPGAVSRATTNTRCRMLDSERWDICGGAIGVSGIPPRSLRVLTSDDLEVRHHAHAFMLELMAMHDVLRRRILIEANQHVHRLLVVQQHRVFPPTLPREQPAAPA